MVPRLDIFLEWELKAVELLAAEGFLLLSDRAKTRGWPNAPPFDENAQLSEGEALDASPQLAVVAAYEHLNTVVDECILFLANYLRPDDSQLTNRDFIQTRSEYLRRIETSCALRVRFLPGFDQVDLLREEANALKHRAGVRQVVPRDVVVNDQLVAIPEVIDVHATIGHLRDGIRGVRTWVTELYRAVSGTVV